MNEMPSDRTDRENGPAVEPRRIIVPKAKERQWVDAIEPGFYRDPETGKVHRSRRRRAWLGFAR